MLTLALLLTLQQAPQGVSVRVQPLELKGAAAADATLVSTALETELRAQGYAVVSKNAAARALVAGTLERDKDTWRLHVALVRADEQVELDDTRLEVHQRDALATAGKEAAKQLASTIRQTWGVRAKIKVR